jgi:hypothetical protein
MDKKRVPLAQWLGRNTASATSMSHCCLPHDDLNKKSRVQGRDKDTIAFKEEKNFQKVHENRYLVSVACGSQSEVWAKSSCGRSAPLGIGTEMVVGSDEIRQTVRCTRRRASADLLLLALN